MDLESNDPGTTYLVEWELLVDELSYKNIEFKKLKEEYAQKEFKIVFMSDIDFKALYGSTAEKVRKQHAVNELKPLKDKINDLEISIGWINNRISYIKHYIKFRSKED